MSDHRMAVKGYINGEQVASFFDESIARMFAIALTKNTTRTIELVNKSGMIGQYTAGKSTPEFKARHDAWVLS